MSSIPVNIAVEDELSEIVLKRLLSFSGRGYYIGTVYRKGGYGYLKRTIQGWNKAAASIPIIILTDLDDAPCPSELISRWLNGPVHPNLVVRIAVKEVESWLLADSNGLATYFRVNAKFVPDQPDKLLDPKAALIDLARKSRLEEIRSGVVPKKNSTAKQGPDYNACLTTFVAQLWNIPFAAERSTSLQRAVAKYASFIPTWV